MIYELVSRPFHPEEIYPVASDADVRQLIADRIDYVVSGISSSSNRAQFLEDLFFIDGDKPFNLVPADVGNLGRVERQRLQQLGIETMQKYGLSLENKRVISTVEDPSHEGIVHEATEYPSDQYPRLKFYRTRGYIKATDDTFQVGWKVGTAFFDTSFKNY